MVHPLLYLTPLGAAALGWAFERIGSRRDRARFHAPGQHVLVGDTRLHVRVRRGSGDGPVIVLEAGAGQWSSHMDSLVAPLNQLGTVVSYDRAGLGWSEPSSGDRSPTVAAQELAELLRQVQPSPRAGSDPQFVLVGQGEAAATMRAFATRYPHQTAGLVFMNGYHESLEERLAKEGVPNPRLTPGLLRAFGWAAHLGVLRILGMSPLACGLDQAGIGQTEIAALQAHARSPRVLCAVRSEMLSALPSEAKSAKSQAPAEAHFEIPTRALVARQCLAASSVPEGFPSVAFNRIWAECSAMLAPPGEAQVVDGDSDDLLYHSPQLVVQCVQSLLTTSPPTLGV